MISDVSLKDPAVHVSVRSASDQEFPATLTATLKFEDERTFSLKLIKNNNVNLHIPVQVDGAVIDNKKKVSMYVAFLKKSKVCMCCLYLMLGTRYITIIYLTIHIFKMKKHALV